jgi:hypothetical protein
MGGCAPVRVSTDMNYAETIERLDLESGKKVWVCVWVGEGEERDVVVDFRGRMERLDSRAGRKVQADETITESGWGGEQLARWVETGEPPPGAAVIVAESDAEGDRNSYIFEAGGRQVGRLGVHERDFLCADYDRHGLTIQPTGVTLTVMNVYRRKRS